MHARRLCGVIRDGERSSKMTTWLLGKRLSLRNVFLSVRVFFSWIYNRKECSYAAMTKAALRLLKQEPNENYP